MNRSVFAICAALLASAAAADNAVVGSGSAASCTTAAYNAAMQQLVAGPQARGGRLSFQCGAQPHTIAMSRSWHLTDDVEIDGEHLITLDGQNLHRFYQLFLLAEGRTEVTLRGIRLIRGFTSTDFGAAVYMRTGTGLTLAQVTIADSHATTSGGAIAADPQTRLRILNSSFLNNRAGDGGALAIRALAEISDSVFLGNRAERDGAEGGAIQSYEQTLSIVDSVFEDNVSAGNGGAILKRNATLILDRVSLLRNQAPNLGAGIHSDASVDVQANRVRAISNDGEALHVEGGLTLTRGFFSGHVRINVPSILRPAVNILSSASPVLIEKSTFTSNIVAVRLERRAGATGTPGTLRLDNVTLYASLVASLVLDDAIGGVDVQVAQSSLVEPNRRPLIARGAQVSYSSSVIFGDFSPNCDQLASGPAAQFSSAGNNLVGPGCPRVGSDGAEIQTLAQLQLGELADNGGGVETLMPALGSPAVDRRSCINVDARDLARPAAATPNGTALCDIGAVERQTVEVPAVLFRNGFE